MSSDEVQEEESLSREFRIAHAMEGPRDDQQNQNDEDSLVIKRSRQVQLRAMRIRRTAKAMALTIGATFILSLYFVGSYLQSRLDFNGQGVYLNTLVVLGQRKAALAFDFTFYKEQLM